MTNFCIKLLGVVLAFTAAITARANVALSIPQQTVEAGYTTTLAIDLTNDEEVTAFQFDLILPEGFTVNTMVNDDEEIVPDIRLTERKMSKHMLSCVRQDNGAYKIVALSMSNQAFRDNAGAIVNVKFTASSTVASGTYPVKLTGIHLVTLADGAQGPRIDQPDYIGYVTVVNPSQGGDVKAAFSVSTSALKVGNENRSINIALTNNIEVTAFQFDIKLPDGISINDYVNEDDESVPDIRLTGRKDASHKLSCNQRENGEYTVVVLSMKNKPFSGSDGDILTLDVNVPLTTSGKQTLTMSNIHIVPLVNGTPGVRIDQADVVHTLEIVNDGSGGDTPAGDMGFSTQSLSLMPGKTGVLNIEMDNKHDVCSFQFNIKLPEGISVVKEYNEDDEFVESILLTERKKSSHELSFKKTEDGGYFLLAYSLSNATFRGNSGSIVSIKVKADENMALGNYGVVITNALLVTPSEERYEQAVYGGVITISDETGINGVNDAGIHIYTRENQCIVEGTSIGDIITLYEISGKLLQQINALNDATTIPVNAGNTVIVDVVKKGKSVATKKIIIK